MMAGLTNENFVIGWRARIAVLASPACQMFDAKGPVGGEQVPKLK